ncbi:MAG: hypothetical protein L3J91_01230, partial [Thermoplasmata archaeon]|nr:hypothetical protein [Thermoplasmata archaeon]
MAGLRDAEPELARALRRIEARTRYADVMAERGWGDRLRLDKKAVTPTSAPRMEGVVFRAWVGAGWVESATSGLTERDVVRAADHLLARLPAQPARDGPPGDAPKGTEARETHQVRAIADFGRE